jgi:hypothetical protein
LDGRFGIKLPRQLNFPGTEADKSSGADIDFVSKGAKFPMASSTETSWDLLWECLRWLKNDGTPIPADVPMTGGT